MLTEPINLFPMAIPTHAVLCAPTDEIWESSTCTLTSESVNTVLYVARLSAVAQLSALDTMMVERETSIDELLTVVATKLAHD